MDLDSRQRGNALLERYGSLLTEHQREILELHLSQDWSLAEIAAHAATSRAAVHDIVRRGLAALEEYERRLGLLAEERRRLREAEGLRRRLAELRRRLERLEAEVARA